MINQNNKSKMMNKKGDAEDVLIKNLIQIVLIALVGISIFLIVNDLSDDSSFRQDFIARDLALLMNIIQSSPYNIEVNYQHEFLTGEYSLEFDFARNQFRIFTEGQRPHSYPFLVNSMATFLGPPFSPQLSKNEPQVIYLYNFMRDGGRTITYSNRQIITEAETILPEHVCSEDANSVNIQTIGVKSSPETTSLASMILDDLSNDFIATSQIQAIPGTDLFISLVASYEGGVSTTSQNLIYTLDGPIITSNRGGINIGTDIQHESNNVVFACILSNELQRQFPSQNINTVNRVEILDSAQAEPIISIHIQLPNVEEETLEKTVTSIRNAIDIYFEQGVVEDE